MDLPVIVTDVYRNQWHYPPGAVFMFNPSDSDLVVYYLRRKVNSLWMLTPNPIIELPDVLHYNPWDLPGENDQMKYFFCPRTRNRECTIDTEHGYWNHGVDMDERIVADGTKSVVAIKKIWAFHSEESNGSRWIMHEISQVRAFEAIFTEKKVKEVGNWNVYRIYDETLMINEEENDDGSDGQNSPTSILDASFQSLSL